MIQGIAGTSEDSVKQANKLESWVTAVIVAACDFKLNLLLFSIGWH